MAAGLKLISVVSKNIDTVTMVHAVWGVLAKLCMVLGSQ